MARVPTLGFVRENAPWLGAGALLTFSSSYGQTFFISVFAGEIRGAFGLSHGQWGAIYAVATFASAMAMVWAGTLTDRFRVRGLARVVLPLYALACLGMALAPGIVALALAVGALRFCGQGMVSHIATVAMARWFVATRGRAVATASLGFALGEAVLPLSFVALMGIVDWRALWVVAGMLALGALVPLERMLREERTPQSDAETTVALGMDLRHWSRKDVLGHWLFWLLVPLLLGPPTFSTAFFFHQVHVAELKGMSHLALVALFPLYTAVAVTTMVASGVVIDRIGTGRLVPLYQLPMGLGFTWLGLAQGVPAVAVGMGLLSLTVGVHSTVMGTLWAEFYGTRHLGAVKAMAAAVMVLGSSIGPILTGALIDGGVGFERQLVGIGIYFAVASALAGLGIARAQRRLPLPA